MPKFYLIIFFGLLGFQSFAQTPILVDKSVVLSGRVAEKQSSEPLWGVSVFISGESIGTITNSFGYFSLEIPAKYAAKRDSITLFFSYLGYTSANTTLFKPFSGNSLGIIELKKGLSLDEVQVDAYALKPLEAISIGKTSISGETLNKIPSFLGEKDVLKGLKLLPGVEGGTEGTSGIYVRGGGVGENLILIDGAPVYNSGHLLGFFSAFPSEPIKQVEVYKGGFPSEYAGRTSSVIDIQLKDGNKKTTSGSAGIGIIGSNFTVEGPIKKDTASFIISARRTYLDLFTAGLGSLVGAPRVQGYYFYDGIAKVSAKISLRSVANLSLYASKDKFYAKDRSEPREVISSNLSWSNFTGTFNLGTQFNPRLFGRAKLLGSSYGYQISTDLKSSSETPFVFEYGSGIQSYTGDYQLQYKLSPKHSLKGGVSFTKYNFSPEEFHLESIATGQDSSRFEAYTANEMGVYLEDEYSPTSRLSFSPGLRLASFNIQSKNYVRLEPRFSAKYRLLPNVVLLGTYARMNQFIVLLANSGTGLPADLWVPIINDLKPSYSDQVSLGADYQITSKVNFNVEGYYKTVKNIIEYDLGRTFFEVNLEDNDPVFESFDEKVVSGNAEGYGVEFKLDLELGKWNGWVSYSLSKTTHLFEKLNNGTPFPARYDRRHDFSTVMSRDLERGRKFSVSWVYQSGINLSLPSGFGIIAIQPQNGFPKEAGFSSSRNGFQTAPTHRLDFNYSTYKITSYGSKSWIFSVYNAYMRGNPFFYEVDTERTNGGERRFGIYKVVLYPIVPSVTLKINF
jgi:hypothetical protein